GSGRRSRHPAHDLSVAVVRPPAGGRRHRGAIPPRHHRAAGKPGQLAAGRSLTQHTTKDFPDMYDLIVIGTGPGGYHAAIRAAQRGLSVAAIEDDAVGGV